MRKFLLLISICLCSIYATATRRALLVGIGEYDTKVTGWNRIHGDNDVDLLTNWLKHCGFSDIKTLKNSQATKTSIIKQLDGLASRCKPGDEVYFHFSGHGQPVKDLNRDEGVGKRFDQSIIPYDACRDRMKLHYTYNGQNHLIDDELAPLLNNIKKKLGPKGELFVVIDACYSRGIEKDEVTDIDPELLRYIRGTDNPFVPDRITSPLRYIPVPSDFSNGATMTVVTACRENERNIEYRAPDGNFYGPLSFYMYVLMKTNKSLSSWRESITRQTYQNQNIFHPSQHPSIIVYKGN